MDEYRKLVRLFLEGNMTTIEFRSAFYNRFKNDATITRKQHDVVEDIFFALEDYVEYPELRAEGELDEEGLANECRKIYKGRLSFNTVHWLNEPG